MSCNLYECLQKCQAGDESSIIELLSRLSPMLAAGAHYLGYEDAYNDLVIYLLAEIKDLKLYTLRNTTDAGIITYFQQVVHHKISRLAIKHRKYNSISYFSELSDGALCSIELKTANNNTYNNLILTDIALYLSPKEMNVVFLLYFKDLSIAQIAKTLGVSRQAVNKIKLSALKKLKTRWQS